MANRDNLFVPLPSGGARPEPDATSLGDLDKAHVWHPFTRMADWLHREPLIIVSGRGVKVTDNRGREYYDGNSSLWVNVHGHCHPHINAAIREQLDRISHSTMLGLSSPPAILLAQRLVEIAPAGLSRVFYSDSGSEAVEIALKMAFQHWHLKGDTRRNQYLALSNGYHGDTVGAVSVGGIDTFHSLFKPILFQSHFAPLAPSTSEAWDLKSTFAGFLKVFAEHADKLAAVVVEPLVQAAGGMRIMPAGFLKGVEQTCRLAGVLLIVDEVATGFGRTGKMFACEHENVHPDLMCLAKGLTGGYLPLAATLANDSVFEPFRDTGREVVFYHGHSYTGNPLACVAALANLDVFENERTIENLAPKIELIQSRLQSIAALAHVAETRQIGMMVGIELVDDKERAGPYDAAEYIGARVCDRARELGMITRPLGDVVVFMPPLASTEPELEDMLQILHHAIVDVTEEAA